MPKGAKRSKRVVTLCHANSRFRRRLHVYEQRTDHLGELNPQRITVCGEMFARLAIAEPDEALAYHDWCEDCRKVYEKHINAKRAFAEAGGKLALS